jgi:hypothetical protein
MWAALIRAQRALADRGASKGQPRFQRALRRRPSAASVWRPAFLAAAALSVYIHGLGAYFYPSGWNGSPENVDVSAARVWQVRDNELGRCQSMLIRSVAKRAPAFLKPAHAASRVGPPRAQHQRQRGAPAVESLSN